MYKIGEFSKIAQMSVKTLRYYHDLGLLLPCAVDEDTGYRYYNDSGYEKAMRIHRLKALDFSLAEIKEILDHVESDEDFSYYYLEKSQALERQINQIKRIQKKLDRMIQQKEVTQMSNIYDITEKMTERMLVASYRYVGRYEDMGTHFSHVFKVVGKHGSGKPPVVLFHDAEYREEDAQIEICIPIREEIIGKNVETKRLESAKVLSVTYQGPYETISDGYKALIDYANSHDYTLLSPSRNIYHKGPGALLKGNPNKYITEIQFPIVEIE